MRSTRYLLSFAPLLLAVLLPKGVASMSGADAVSAGSTVPPGAILSTGCPGHT